MKFLMMRYTVLVIVLLMSMTAFADDFTLKGKVVDENERALELVTVSCLAQGKVTMTNLKGEFTLHLKSADSIEVRFSMVGYAQRKRVFRTPKKQLTVQIADALEKNISPQGVMVMIEAEHMCMTMRGIKKPGSKTVTYALRGCFRDDIVKQKMFMEMLRA